MTFTKSNVFYRWELHGALKGTLSMKKQLITISRSCRSYLGRCSDVIVLPAQFGAVGTKKV